MVAVEAMEATESAPRHSLGDGSASAEHQRVLGQSRHFEGEVVETIGRGMNARMKVVKNERLAKNNWYQTRELKNERMKMSEEGMIVCLDEERKC